MSVSLPEADVEFLDAYARERGFDSRSAVLHKAVRMLRALELGDAYADAWKEFAGSGDADAWDRTSADGIDA